MKTIEKDELYEHLSDFLKGRGIEIKERNYAPQFQKGCAILTDAVNLTQQGMERAKTEIDKRLDQLRQIIHEKTAPAQPPPQAPPPQTNPAATQAASTKRPNRRKVKARKERRPVKRRK